VNLSLQFPRAYLLSLHKFFFDEIYYRFLVRPVENMAAESGGFDKSVIDWTVDFVGSLPSRVGRGLREWQTGLVQSYAAVMFMGVAVMAALVWFIG
jgi:NADH:ubiquinone oxidoreductase subunit 5 (subunit L)/multisubunit Na+/H+ antiporter MnhA subunit